MQEGHLLDGQTPYERHHEMVEEAALAEEVGFDFYTLPEQHFHEKVATVSAPEVLFAYIASRTSRLRLRFASNVLLTFNHPLRIAERIAELDIVSGGRVEVGTARSNALNTLEAFGVDPSTTREQWGEAMELLQLALSQEFVEFDGAIWKVPRRRIQPRPVQQPHPRLYVSATSMETHRLAGEMGLAVMNGNNILGWDYLQTCIDEYRAGIADAEAAGKPTEPSLTVTMLCVHCDDDPALALRESEESAYLFVDVVLDMYTKLAAASPDYEYLGQVQRIADHRRDLDHLMGLAPYITIGTPQFIADRVRRLREMGADEVLMRIDGMGHDAHMRAIEKIGREVIAPLKAELAEAVS
jgi:alkanesulfonate monooxygenase SsuD/methylene tetrahydromethanopterin reductase-like flavin-dependent oxidoreductase (luciferase family)